LVDEHKTEDEQPEPDPGEEIAWGIAQYILILGIVAILSKLVIPAFTDWRPPEFAVWVVAAIAFGIVAGSITRRRHEERPYEQQLEELRKQAGEPSSPEPVPPRSE
jgi:hypothetical protein